MSTENVIPFLKNEKSPLTILVVEDEKLERLFLEQHIKELGHFILEAENGAQALDILKAQAETIDIILMDRMMPVMDGLSAVRKIKDNKIYRNIPIVMVTGATEQRQIQEGIEAGVFYYLTKPVDTGMLRSVLSAAERDAAQNRILHEELQRHKANFNLIETCKFKFSTLEQAESLSAFIAQCFPEPRRVLPGLAELMINAVEHGICAIGYDRKSDLVDSGTLRAEVARRLSLPDYSGHTAEAVVTRKDNGVYVVITDPGKGFDWKSYMRIEPSRAMDNHGRGIAQANALSFDKLTFNAEGNQAVGFVGGVLAIDW